MTINIKPYTHGVIVHICISIIMVAFTDTSKHRRDPEHYLPAMTWTLNITS